MNTQCHSDLPCAGRRTTAGSVARMALAAAVSVSLLATAPAAAQQLTGVTFTYATPFNPSYLYTINQGSGVAFNQRSTGVVGLVGLARIPGTPTQAYAINTHPGTGAHKLYKIILSTGAATLIGDTGIHLFEGDLAFDNTGILYALTFDGSNPNGGYLCQISTMTGAASTPVEIVGSPNSPFGGPGPDYSAMAFDASNNLWIIDNSFSPTTMPTYLLKVNAATGVVSSSVLVSPGHLGTTCGMAFHPTTGELWVGDGTQNGSNTIYKLNTSTGVLTTVGNTGLPSTDGLSGLSFAPPMGFSTYCTPGTMTAGCVPNILALGTPSASANSGFDITVTGVEGQKTGLLFYGISGPAAVPWGPGSSSYLCVKAPTQRMSLQSSGGTNGMCNGSLTEDWNAFIASHPSALGQPFAGGETVYVQAWFRDPAAVKTTNLSDALEFDVEP